MRQFRIDGILASVAELHGNHSEAGATVDLLGIAAVVRYTDSFPITAVVLARFVSGPTGSDQPVGGQERGVVVRMLSRKRLASCGRG